MSHVLIVDDEPSICWGFREFLSDEGHDVSVAASAEEALQIAARTRPDAVVLDVRLPGMDGLTAIRQLREQAGDVPVIVMTAFGNLETAVRAVREGAFEYLSKPFDLDRAAELVNRALQSRPVPSPTSEIPSRDAIVGSSPSMQQVFRQIAMVADADVPVLITGESGTGKEGVARAIHAHSARSREPFLPVCLPALSSGVVESELFGHARGSFTGAVNDRKGLLELAGRGTVLLDEIADASLGLQVKLLRALEQREVHPVGEASPRPIHARIIAATNRQLPERIQSGEFREDLYFRLSVFHIALPPLRDRLDDLPALAQHFFQMIRPGQAPLLTSDVIDELQSRPWIGNVRELRNAIEHAAIVSRGGPLRREHLPPSLATPHAPASTPDDELPRLIKTWTSTLAAHAPADDDNPQLYEQFLNQVEPPLLRTVLAQCQGNRAAAAQRLGLHRTTLRQKLRKYGIE